MTGDKRSRLKQWLESGEARLHPLTLPQRELWENSAVPVTDSANHICCLIHVRGLLTQTDSETALQRVVARQEALRLSFLPGKDRPLQLMRRTAENSLQFRELNAAQSTPEAIEEIAQESFNEPFDFLSGPLYRAIALRHASDHHTLVFAIHHAIADGWTLGVFIQDLFGAYLQRAMGISEPLPAVPLTYSAWGAAETAYWQPSELESRATYWRSALAGSGKLWKTPAALPSLKRWVSSISPALTSAVRDLSKRNGTTLFSTLLTAFKITLAQWSGADDVTIGTPVANRNKAATRETMGYFAGNVPMRKPVARDQSFVEYLRSVHQMTVDGFSNAMPFAELVRAVGEKPAAGSHFIYDVRFALQNHPVPDVALPTLSSKLRMRSTGTSRFDLGCEVTEQDSELEVAWLFRTSRLGQTEIEELNRLFQSALSKACSSPESRVAVLMNSAT